MPFKPPRHRPNAPARPPEVRPSAARRGYGRDWQAASKRFLDAHPLCSRCSTDAAPVGADVVDHVIPHRGDPALFWDESNWQPLCDRCHSRKTAREDGGLGRPARLDSGPPRPPG